MIEEGKNISCSEQFDLLFWKLGLLHGLACWEASFEGHVEAGTRKSAVGAPVGDGGSPAASQEGAPYCVWGVRDLLHSRGNAIPSQDGSLQGFLIFQQNKCIFQSDPLH